MEISGVQTQALATGLDVNSNVGTSVLKKAMDIQQQTAAQLIEAIPETPAPVGNKGNNINIKV